MSADGNVKIALSPLAAVLAKKPSASVNIPQVRRVCGFCELPLGAQPPVLPKVGAQPSPGMLFAHSKKKRQQAVELK